MQCEHPDCDEKKTTSPTQETPHEAGWRLVGSHHLDIEGSSANTRLCPDHAEEYDYL